MTILVGGSVLHEATRSVGKEVMEFVVFYLEGVDAIRLRVREGEVKVKCGEDEDGGCGVKEDKEERIGRRG